MFPFLTGVVESTGFYQLQPDVNKILEVGCGYGTDLDVFRKKGFTAVGTEASPARAPIVPRARAECVRLPDRQLRADPAPGAV